VHQASIIIKQAEERVSSCTSSEDEHVVALLQDISGQATEAFARLDWFQRWGVHYALSAMFAHKLQQCNNFKDPGVQVYGGNIFRDLRDEADDLFCQMPAPVSMPAEYRCVNRKMERNPHFRRGAPFQAPTAVVSMAQYHNPSGVCIAGDSPVQLASGAWRCVSELVKGDAVMACGAVAVIACVVRTVCPGGLASLVHFPGGARLTPNHPIKFANEWRFPGDVGDVIETACDAVYSFVLEGRAPYFPCGWASMYRALPWNRGGSCEA